MDFTIRKAVKFCIWFMYQTVISFEYSPRYIHAKILPKNNASSIKTVQVPTWRCTKKKSFSHNLSFFHCRRSILRKGRGGLSRTLLLTPWRKIFVRARAQWHLARAHVVIGFCPDPSLPRRPLNHNQILWPLTNQLLWPLTQQFWPWPFDLTLDSVTDVDP